MTTTSEDRWPPLPYDEWKETYATLHMWSQVVGKVALASSAPLNHSWGVALHLTSRGMTTQLLRRDAVSFTIQFDFVSHRLIIATSDGAIRTLPLVPMTVADFYRQLLAALNDLSVHVKIWPMAVEIPSPFRLDVDTAHRTYDPEYANRFWRILVSIQRVFAEARCTFVGKCSPVHFFWGSFDLAVTRFSGRPAPPREGPAFMRDAYSHEVISHGFWPGGGPIPEAVFYAYSVPEPAGFKEALVRPSEAFYSKDMGEFFLPYDAVRRAPSPENAIRAFIDSTYEAAADLADWDRDALERRNVIQN